MVRRIKRLLTALGLALAPLAAAAPAHAGFTENHSESLTADEG
jgi:hypothetical protein